jgi:phosphatidate cytidylyltransferase
MNGSAPSNLQQRVLSGAVLIVVALALTWAGGIWYRVLAAAISGAVLYEWLSMTARAEAVSHRWLAIGLLAILLALLLAGQPISFLLMALVGAVFVTAAHAVKIEAGYWVTLGLAYAGLLGLALAGLRGSDAAGLSATLFLFAVVWATDILAYFVGRAIGGPKLAPSISPGKTWSGAAGGTVAAVLAGTGVAHLLGSPLWLGAVLALTFLLSVLSQIGDLFESAIKRRFGAKDSSQLIPGHGGVMDRVDGLAVAAFALFLLGVAIAGPEAPASAFFGH